MDNRPHSRDKKVESGSVEVRKGEKVGSSPVGSGARPNGTQSGFSEGRSGERSNGSMLKTGLLLFFFTKLFGNLSPKGKRIVLLVAAVLLIFSLMRGFMTPGNPVTVDPTPVSQPSSGSTSQTQPSLDPSLSNGGSSGNTNTTPSNPSSTGNETAPTSDPSTQTPVSTGSVRDHYYTPNADDSVTVMVYMCGTDLESKYSMGTSDLVEMANATIADNVNIIVETGGCRKWQNNVISSSTNQIIKVTSGGKVITLEKDLGDISMVNPLNLTSFIQYCATKYPAERNILIMWDHGGGSVTGYGYDEKHSSDGSMDLAEFNSALNAAGIKFDWIGFDACLMQTLETAMVCDDYADYLIASEESEPGTGWFYTNWVTQLSRNTGVATTDLAKTLIDDFYQYSLRSQSSAQVTLSILDLAEVQGKVPAYLTAFSQSTNQLINSDNYKAVSNARSKTTKFASSQRLNQIDLIDFAERVGTSDAKKLASVLRSCVKYNRTNISNANGVSIYFPYENTRTVNSALNTYNQIGFDSSYSACVRSFASLVASGQASAGTSYYQGYGSSSGYDLSDLLQGSSPLGSLLGGYTDQSGSYSSGYSVDPELIYQLLTGFSGRNIPSEYSWIDTDTVHDAARYISDNRLDPSHIVVSFNKAGNKVVTLSDEDWDLIQSVELNVYVDDGAGYIDLGRDNVFEISGNDLILDYDHTWLTINRHVVAYYMESDVEQEDGSWTTTGLIPAILKSYDESGESFEQMVNLEIVFDKDNPYGVITGARPMYNGETDAIAKGNIEIKENDVLQFLCDYYTYDGKYESTHLLGSPLTVPASGLSIANRKIDYDCSVTYRLTDIYANYYWTPAFISQP